MNKKIVEKVNSYFLEALKRKIVPWKQPWHTGQAYNYVGKNFYHGINAILLNTYSNKYSCPAYATFNQINHLHGRIRKNEKGYPVIYWKILEKEVTNEEGEKEIVKIPLLRYYTVWNIKQTTGINYKEDEKMQNEAIQSAEQIVKSYKGMPGIEKGQPAYSPRLDKVYIYDITDFDSSDDYYATLFHELAHSTGHKKRLNRFKDTNSYFGSKDYSFEELVAEIASAYLRGIARIESNLENSAAYIKHWIAVLESNPEWIIRASGKSQRACDYILGNVKEESKAA